MYEDHLCFLTLSFLAAGSPHYPCLAGPALASFRRRPTSSLYWIIILCICCVLLGALVSFTLCVFLSTPNHFDRCAALLPFQPPLLASLRVVFHLRRSSREVIRCLWILISCGRLLLGFLFGSFFVWNNEGMHDDLHIVDLLFSTLCSLPLLCALRVLVRDSILIPVVYSSSFIANLRPVNLSFFCECMTVAVPAGGNFPRARNSQ
jgi:hypothetical protein